MSIPNRDALYARLEQASKYLERAKVAFKNDEYRTCAIEAGSVVQCLTDVAFWAHDAALYVAVEEEKRRKTLKKGKKRG